MSSPSSRTQGARQRRARRDARRRDRAAARRDARPRARSSSMRFRSGARARSGRRRRRNGASGRVVSHESADASWCPIREALSRPVRNRRRSVRRWSISDEAVRADRQLEVDGEASAARQGRDRHRRQRAGRQRRRRRARAREPSVRAAARPRGRSRRSSITPTAAWDPPYLALTPAMAAQKLLERTASQRATSRFGRSTKRSPPSRWSTAHAPRARSENRSTCTAARSRFGHPIGASGARITARWRHHQLRRRGGGLGIAAICSGGGQGDASAPGR